MTVNLGMFTKMVRQVLITALWVLNVSVAYAGAIPHPALLAESPYSNTGVNQQTDQPMWEHVLASLGLPGVTLSGATLFDDNQCQYTEAIDTLHQILLQEGTQSPYLQQWVFNQNKAFSACDGTTSKDTPPQPLKGNSWPKRADSDEQYQLASWYFYERQYQKALPIYQHIAKLIDAPH